jgi:hypothetical protein
VQRDRLVEVGRRPLQVVELAPLGCGGKLRMRRMER